MSDIFPFKTQTFVKSSLASLNTPWKPRQHLRETISNNPTEAPISLWCRSCVKLSPASQNSIWRSCRLLRFFFFLTGVINRLWYDMENGSRVGVLTRFRLSHQLFLKAKKDVNRGLISVFHVHCTETLSNYRKAHKATRWKTLNSR